MTEYEFEYEFLLKNAFHKMIKDEMNGTKIDLANGGLNREFSMDEDEYNEIIDRAENGEFIDFEIPPDAAEGKRLSESLVEVELRQDEQVPVDLSEIFGGGTNG